MPRLHLFAVLLAVASFGVGEPSLRAECVTISPIGPDGKPLPLPPSLPEVITVSGALCGSAWAGLEHVSFTFPFELLRSAEVNLVAENDFGVLAKAPTDANGRFRFAPLPPGRYRAYLPGFASSFEIIEITNANQRRCESPVFVRLNAAWECDPPSHVSTTPPPANAIQ